jgi:palmitoyltransferase
MGMDINKKDKKGSTPLHWAAFSGAELSLSYIVSWDVDVNEQDTRGFTALHLAVKSSEDLRSTRSLRHLLIKGADRHIRTYDEANRPIDIADELRTPAMKEDISKLLEENESIIGDCLMLRPPLKKLKKSPKTMIIFYSLMVFSYILHLVVVFPKIHTEWIKITCSAVFALSMFFGALCCFRDPGYLQKDEKYDFLELLQMFDPSCLCPECEVIRTPRSRHCNIC